MPFKIYYLDDEPDLREIMSDMLSSNEVRVETFGDVSSLLSRCEIVKPDLFFLDYRLPGITGDDVAWKLDPGIPKVLITGDISLKTTYKFNAVLSKTISRKDILSLIETIKKMN
jgi:CheY-like chemotaxis protein